jgi:hypothetical protein
MNRNRVSKFALLALAAAFLAAGCNQTEVAEKSHPATIDSTETKGIMRVTLTAQAAQRIGLQTAQVREDGARKLIPYGALMYDTKGDIWTFTSPKPLTFVREKVVVTTIEGNDAILSEGPPTGTTVVTVGAAELMGAEHKYGH